MKKFLIIVLLLCVLSSLTSCAYNASVSIDYTSKKVLLNADYTVKGLKAKRKDDLSYKFTKKAEKGIAETIKSLPDYYGECAVIDKSKDKAMFDGKLAFIMTNGDSYFAFGKEGDYYRLKELVSYISLVEDNSRAVLMEFAAIPELYNYKYDGLSRYKYGLPGENEIAVNIMWNWEQLKSYYSKLEYAHIDDDDLTITLNCYTVSANIEQIGDNLQIIDGNEYIDAVSFRYEELDHGDRLVFLFD
ncbi:MAG TPA: hypothetical protein GXZ92_02905 [Clostridiales bacterium]|nr:hypothetical protein [Clostridiales bacterium]